MERKYFPLDKNYLLERAQLEQEGILIRIMVEHVMSFYLNYCNPLGIEDDIIRKIKAYSYKETSCFSEFYRDLAGIYRYHNSGNQLEILFDGSDHSSKYSREWGDAFCSQIQRFCQHPSFIKAIFSLTIFPPEENQIGLKTNRLKYFLQQFFQVKIYKYKGIQEQEAA